MSGFTLAPSAARDPDSIWHYLAVEQSRRQLYRIEVRGPCILQIVHGSRELRNLFRD